MKEKVYLFGAYFGTKKDGSQEIGNYLHEYQSMPSIDEMRNTIRKGNEELSSAIVLNMQFLTKEQFYALKGEKPNEQQSELGE